MKKKIIIIAIVAVIFILPMIIAISSYSNALRHPVTKTSVSQLKMSTPDGTDYLYSKTDSNNNTDLFSLLFDINDTSNEISSLPSKTDDFTCYVVEYTSYNKKTNYSYYLSDNPSNMYYKDSNGKYHKINEKAAGNFLTSVYASQLFPNSSQPALIIADREEIAPVDMTWKYQSHDESFIDAVIKTSDKKQTVNCSGGLQLSFTTVPDFISVSLTTTDGLTAYDGLYEDLNAELFTDNIVYDVTITAKWYASEGRKYYGEGTFKYTANVLSPAVFYVNLNECDYGDFIIISAKNIVDPSQIGFVSEPKIYGAAYDDSNKDANLFKPEFFEYGGYYHALIPFSVATCTANKNTAAKYNITLSYGESYQEIKVNVSPRTIKSAYLNSSLEKINTYLTDATLSSFRNVVNPYLNSKCSDFYWISDSTVLQPVNAKRKVHYGFGIKMVPNNKTSAWYWNDGVDYYVNSNDEVLACLPGQIVYVGETTYSGTTIIVEHGCGLKSLYSHLGSTAVKVGDSVSKGEVIGIVGSTGFCDSRSLHFGLYIFDVPVRYYDYEENGIVLNGEVASAIGLNAIDQVE